MNWRKPIIYGLLYLSGSKILKYLKEIKRIEKLPQEEIKKYQEEKLKKILLHAHKNVPYYHKILSKAKVVIDGKVNLNNFNKIPILTKEIIRKEGKNLYSKDYKKRRPYENTSGGSTGEPVRFIQDKEYNGWNIANKIFYKIKAGQKQGNKELRFWGSERDLLGGKESLKMRLRNWLYNRREFNTFKMSEKEMFEYVKGWNKYKSSWIESYVQSIYEFAKFIEQNKLEIHSPKNGILTSAGTLFPEMRTTIEKVFKCPVYNRYGSREVGDMACGKDILKLSLWNHKIETNKKGGIYVTALNNYSMPMIRYDIGDMGKLSRDKMSFGKLEGRGMSVFKTKEGKKIPAEFFIHFIGVVYNNDSIDKFQVIQKDYNLIKIKAVLRNRKQFEKDKIKINKVIKLEMGKDCKIKWEFVKDIKPIKSGKYLYTVSEVK